MSLLPVVLAVTLFAPPQPVLDGLHARFPGAEITKWSKESEHGKILYDVEFTQDGKKLEADIGADGTIDNWELQIPVAELPQTAKDGALAAHAGASIVQAMACMRVTNGKDEVEGYEMVLQPPRGKKVEVTVAPDGKILEDGDED